MLNMTEPTNVTIANTALYFRQTKGDESMIEQYRVDTAEMQDKISRLKEDATTFQVSKCSACNHTLELPSVHFLCQHSYHQHCFQRYNTYLTTVKDRILVRGATILGSNFWGGLHGVTLEILPE